MPEKAPQPKTHKCPHCEQLFTEKGLPGHIAFKHNAGGAREAPKEQQQQPPKGLAAPVAGKGAPAAGGRGRSKDAEFCGFEPFDAE